MVRRGQMTRESGQLIREAEEASSRQVKHAPNRLRRSRLPRRPGGPQGSSQTEGPAAAKKPAAKKVPSKKPAAEIGRHHFASGGVSVMAAAVFLRMETLVARARHDSTSAGLD